MAAAQGIKWAQPYTEVRLNYDDGSSTVVRVEAWFARFLSARPDDCPMIADAVLGEEKRSLVSENPRVFLP